MIPFASQRGGGQDLATHLMNAHDNEQIELFQVRGAIARDLHGAFAEWEALARALTRCRQYLCSLSINPDELRGRLTRAQYVEYIERAEERLGLKGQPRAIIFHVKADERGRTREHCHVVWSRIDVDQGKAVPLSFFKEKMMTVTREFARDHGLELPEGYRRQEDELRRRNRQLSGYDCIKQKETGISHEERMAAVTAAWQRSDNGKAFVSALADLGYILACGRNSTRFVLVDFYGHTTALTRLIDDPAVRAAHVREFLGAAYAAETLPSVEQAQEMAAQRRNAIEAFEKARAEGGHITELVRAQAARRQELESETALLWRRQHEERAQLAVDQKLARQALKTAYLAAQQRTRTERARRRPQGLAAFLGRVTGIALVTKKVQRYRDRKRYGAYLAGRDALKRRQQHEREVLARRHELQAADFRRKLRALDQIEQRERQTLEKAALKERRRAINARHTHMPPLALALKPRGGTAVPKAGQRHNSPLAQELARAVEGRKAREAIRLSEAFGRASGDEGDGDTGRGESGSPQPAAEAKIEHKKQRATQRLRNFNAVARGDEGESGAQGETEAPAPAAETKIRRRKRRKVDLERAFNEASGDGDGSSGGDDSGGGPRRRRRRPDRDPPDDHDPPRPHRTRKRQFRPKF